MKIWNHFFSLYLRNWCNFRRFHDRIPRISIWTSKGDYVDGTSGLARLDTDRGLAKPLHDPHWKIPVRIFGRRILSSHSSNVFCLENCTTWACIYMVLQLYYFSICQVSANCDQSITCINEATNIVYWILTIIIG